MSIQIGNKVILTPLPELLMRLRSQLTNGKLKVIDGSDGRNIKVTCPIHKDGRENKASCFILTDSSDKKVPIGTAHCFSCGYSANFFQFVADCLDADDELVGKNWVFQNSEIGFLSDEIQLEPIDVHKKIREEFLDESTLDKYRQYHDYMWERKLSKDIVDLFEVGYDEYNDSLTFPVRDEFGRLLFITRRSVKTKKFIIPKGVKKPVYLLYYCIKNNINRVAVCESQINTLYCWSLGIPAVGLFGTGDDYQYNTLNKSGIRVYDTFFDGDEAGNKGFYRFRNGISNESIVNRHILPSGKDVNDLTYEEIKNLPVG